MDGGQSRTDELRAAAVALDAAALADARLGFYRAHRSRSAKRALYVSQLVAIALFVTTIIFAATVAPSITFNTIHIAALALFAIAILWRLIAAGQLTDPLSRIADPVAWPTYTILCPLYREANVIANLVAALDRLDYPRDKLDIKLLVEGDDAETLDAALRAVAAAPHFEVVAIPPASPRTKPKALNAGLARARGAYVVVYDAEDCPHPQQLRAALAAFEEGDAQLAGVQAPLVVDNGEESWIARQFAAEYAIQFRELLPFLARLNLPLPLGGSSNHFSTDILRASGGWDPHNVSEDRANFANKLNRFRTRASHIPFVSHSRASAA